MLKPVLNKPFRIFRILYLVLSVLYFAAFILMPDRITPDAVKISAFLIVGAAFAALLGGRTVFDFRRPIRENLGLLAVTAVFLTLFSVSGLLDGGKMTLQAVQDAFGRNTGLVLYGILFLKVPLTLAAVLILTNLAANGLGILYQRPVQAMDDFWFRRTRLLFMILISFAAALFLAANYPFRPNADAATMVVANLNHSYSDFHTIGYQLFTKVCSAIRLPLIASPFISCIVQSVIWLVIVFRSFGTIRGVCPSKGALVTYGLLNLVFFQPLMYLGVPTKDTIFSMFVLGLFFSVLDFAKKERLRWWDFLFLVLAAVGVSVFRHAGIVPGIIGIVLALGFARHRKKIRILPAVLMAAIPAAAFFSLQIIGNTVLHMEKNPAYVKYTLPLYITAAFAEESPEDLSDEDLAVMEEFMPLSDWQEGYRSDPFLADTVSRPWCIPGDRIYQVDDAYGAKILKVNLDLVLRHPFKYAEKLLNITSILWEITTPVGGEVWEASEFYSDEPRPELSSDSLLREDFVEMGLVTVWNSATVLLNALEYPFYHSAVLHDLWFRGGIWLFLNLLTIARLLKKKSRYVLAYLPITVIHLLLMLSVPAQDFRYVLPAMEIGVVSIVLNLFLPEFRDRVVTQ